MDLKIRVFAPFPRCLLFSISYMLLVFLFMNYWSTLGQSAQLCSFDDGNKVTFLEWFGVEIICFYWSG
ncbi:hypothetical protein L228DRAFT_145906 [Xylona heveae TC161]|uniref:Uncharacterized protein n=1 Tax=Xylona heveae (strain CBS 132557 / TC161) TaxID=1328760 RepID=A0A165GDW0_XYLHT|nr:hypothetical protein L228DRAFT_145906 [Xylona heveae TC161]KZF22073.1 hypothetical protein L228DRAFT_145906 [Xylona heveae TC161]